MPYIPPEVVEKAREMDLLTYLKKLRAAGARPFRWQHLNAANAIEYLRRRGIDRALIDFCISTGRLYESYPITMPCSSGKTGAASPAMPICAASTPMAEDFRVFRQSLLLSRLFCALQNLRQ